VKDVEGILNWVRDRKDKQGPETAPSKKVDQLIPQKPGESPVSRAKDIFNVLTWFRDHGVDIEEDAPHGPVAPGKVQPRRSQEDRVIDIEVALVLLRKQSS
jgi:hypothetical protein